MKFWQVMLLHGAIMAVGGFTEWAVASYIAAFLWLIGDFE